MRAGSLLVLTAVALAVVGAYCVGAGAGPAAIVAIITAWILATLGAALTPPGDWTK